jgi:hypothetical protein
MSQAVPDVKSLRALAHPDLVLVFQLLLPSQPKLGPFQILSIKKESKKIRYDISFSKNKNPR